ncbi:MAG: fibronectin type III domain-containing protein [Candidatus Eisenbacteria bacterium]|uniref:Fibronectin type III domain-containing protein n=1 Tax=Eiseniibacteriota bacterium TaxID=2212470 RepID=A0A933SCZ9_UNCEI|nr:fibronectin type III domain-containing protein [Candidatus Eisenbacteria bacterium]
MRRKLFALVLALFAFALAGCDETTAPRDTTPPAAPRGLYSTTGDAQVTLRWLANTESDVIGYRVYSSSCASGSSCPYDRVGTATGTSFVVTGLSNGVTRFYAVAAVDRDGNESELTVEDVYDTSRPAGSGATLGNFVNSASGAGWDFSAAISRSSDDAQTDVFYGYNGSVHQMFTRDNVTDIQDMGYASSLDAIDYAPANGWSPTGTVEVIPGHCYVVWTRDNHYAKFRVTSLTNSLVVFDWAYQTAAGNGELRARRAPGEDGTLRPIAWLR